MVCQPQFLLFCDTHASDASSPAMGSPGSCFGRWHFVLDRLDRPEHLEAADSEPAIHPDRLALLSVVRGLEALDEPSRVNLVTTSRYVSRGLKYGLSNWRESDYQWERFGVQKPVRNADLWQRVDRALKFHGVTCRLIQSAPAPAAAVPAVPASSCMAEQASAEGLGGLAIAQLQIPALAPTSPPSLLPTSPSLADLRGAKGLVAANGFQRMERPLQLALCSEILRFNWWGLAISWIKWWRGRCQHRPLYFGT